MSSRKRRRLEDAGLKDYIDEVKDGKIEGIFGPNLFVQEWNPHDPVIKKFRDRGEFEIQPLMLNNMETGWARCTDTLCQERMLNKKNERIFQVQQNNRDGLLKKNVIRHFEQHHLTEEELIEKRQNERNKRIAGRSSIRSVDSDQPLIDSFAQPALKKLSPQVVEELKILNAAVIAEAGLSLDFFTKASVIERDRFLLKSLGYDPDQISRFDRGSGAVKNDLFKSGSKNADVIKRVAPQLAEKSRLALLIDHQAILQLSNETNRDAFGTGIILSADDDKRYNYLASFESVPSTTTEETVRRARQVAQEGE